MFNYVINFIENNMAVVIVLASLFFSLGIYFKCLKKMIVLSAAFVGVYALVAKLTNYGVINDKFHNFLASTIYYILFYIESYSWCNLALKEIPFLKMVELFHMLFISSFFVLILNLTNFYRVAIIINKTPREYLKKISELLKNIQNEIKESFTYSRSINFQTIILNC